MKRTIIFCMLVASLGLVALPVMADEPDPPTYTGTGHTLMIGGLVPLILELELTPHPNAQYLPLVGDGDDPQLVATLKITTNSSTGWELWAHSVNNSKLVNANGDSIDYKIRYGDEGDGLDISPAGDEFGTGVVIASGEYPDDEQGQLTETNDLYIIYTQSETFRAGYYSDQIAIVLRAQ